MRDRWLEMIVVLGFGVVLVVAAPPEASEFELVIILGGALGLLALAGLPRLARRAGGRGPVWLIAASVLLAATVGVGVSYVLNLDDLTFAYPPDEPTARFLAGSELTERGRVLSEKGASKAEIVAKCGGIDKRPLIWTSGWRRRTKRVLGGHYFALVVLLGGAMGCFGAHLARDPRARGWLPRAAPRRPPAKSAGGPTKFDVFLSYNRRDGDAVEAVARSLMELGLRPWLDVWELPPGKPWQPELEKRIEEVGAAAVFVGKEGVGPWQRQEIDSLLRELVNRGLPVIPVLLPDAPQEPELPLFLEGNTWVDFRPPDPDSLDRLVWGIRQERGGDGVGEER